ncbi:MAG: peroxiredoxin [Candidatus Fonsibacter sp.]|jgi:peroxiredoxin|nr:redoxin domain-containing protein [Pelagibacterales bacterium]
MIEKIPSVSFITRPEKDFVTITSDQIFKDKKIILFAVPGAFTPTCNDYHLPGYELEYDEFKNLGVNEIYCLSVNDPFVLKAWSKSLNIKNIKMLPDNNMNFSKAVDMLTDRSKSGMGTRSKRYSMFVDNKNIIKVFIDQDGKFEVSDARTMLNYLRSL